MAKKKKKLVLVLHAKATFRTEDGKQWSSELAWARVVYRPQKDNIAIIHRFGQRPKGASALEPWALPHFPKSSVRQMEDYARRVYNGEIDSRGGKDGKGHLKGHHRELCQRCTELGRSCR